MGKPARNEALKLLDLLMTSHAIDFPERLTSNTGVVREHQRTVWLDRQTVAAIRDVLQWQSQEG